MAGDDPTAIRSIAVTPNDVIAAFEANRQRDAGTVLRITPPFSGRMRARIHRSVDDEGDTHASNAQSIHVDPERLLADSVVGAYPSPDDTADDLRSNPDETYSRERHREYHAAAVESWRESARKAVVDSVVLETWAGSQEVTVKSLG